MATKNYMINDKWLDIDKQNIIELQSVDGELDSLKVNGYEIVEPSGKITITENGTDIDIAQYATADVNVESEPSDFSTATMRIVNNNTDVSVRVATISNDELWPGFGVGPNISTDKTVVLYKNSGRAIILDDAGEPVNMSVTGDASIEDDVFVIYTGDCVVTIS